ncbi:MAG TPA: PAS domain-containing protein, partial [Pseudomonadales bacterium]|nr:PAS domain-containing protein [Pseudomonadales bacterium]
MNTSQLCIQDEPRAPQQFVAERQVAAQEAAGIACFEYDPGSGLLCTTPVGQALLELPEPAVSLAGLHELGIISQTDWLALLADFSRALAQKLEVEHTFEFTSGVDKVRGWLLLRAAVRSDPGYGHDIIVGTFQDITCQKSEYDEVRELSRMLSDAERLAGAFAWELDVLSDKFTVSPNWLAMLDLPPGTKPTREGLLASVVSEDRHIVERMLVRAIKDGDAFDLELLADVGGTEKYLHLYAEPVLDTEGNVVKL